MHRNYRQERVQALTHLELAAHYEVGRPLPARRRFAFSRKLFWGHGGFPMVVWIGELSQYAICKSQHDFKMFDILFDAGAQMPRLKPVNFDGLA